MKSLLLLAFLAGCSGGPERSPQPVRSPEPPAAPTKATGLYWFIPDGMRADPEVFDVFRWAAEGKLPNIAKLMEQGSYGYSIPTFPSHTPTNFATLLTGATPRVHGVADGPMHIEGQSLERPSVGGFSSAAKKVPPAWTILEQDGRSVYLLSVPGSTPPELRHGGTTVRGRWGGWGADFPSIVFERDDAERRKELGRTARLFMQGEELTRFVSPVAPEGWTPLPASQGTPQQLTLTAHGLDVHALVMDTTDDGQDNADTIAFSLDKTAIFASLKQGEWSEWQAVQLKKDELLVDSNIRLSPGRIAPDGHFRIRLQVDALNRLMADPPEAADALRADAGPMVDFVDSFPAQLVHYPEDKATFLDESKQSLEWHRTAVASVYKSANPDIFIHDIYTPNQMLTSRWWMGYLDPASTRYGDVGDSEREQLWAEVHDLYERLDAIVGEAMAQAGPDRLVVLSSDHGAAPMNRQARLNNFFQSRGWLSTKVDPATGAPVVDWDHTRVVFLNMYSIYLHPDGLAGPWTRGSGPEYEALRSEVATALGELRDDDGTAVVASVTKWEDAPTALDLPVDRVGDLIVANHVGYGWSEELTEDGAVFTTPKSTGYKQGIEPLHSTAVWTPFVIAGPGVKAGHRIEQPIRHPNQLPTILTLLGEEIPDHVEGTVLTEILAD